jgi:ABC-type phosphate transport system substrate-binding protein
MRQHRRRVQKVRTYLTFLKCLLVTAVFCVFSAYAAQDIDLKVIANPSVRVSSVSADELKNIFLVTKTSLSGGSHVEPVLEKSGPTHEAFLKHYLGKTDAALNTYYRSLVFTGKAFMPTMLGSDAEVVAYVARTKGAIGYVSASTSVPGAKAIAVR